MKRRINKWIIRLVVGLCLTLGVGFTTDNLKVAKAAVSDDFTQATDNGGGSVTQKPELTCAQTSFNTTYGGTFVIQRSGSATKMYYKTPTMSSYAVTTAKNYLVASTQSDGMYYFYAADDAGNTSSTVWINLKVAAPEASVTYYESYNRYRITWTDDSTGKLNGESYTSGSWITAEGDYTFVLTNISRRSSTYTFSIEHLYKVYSTLSATCTTGGYTTYKCLSCSSTYKSNYTNAKGHNYIEGEDLPTCTTDGATYTYCTRCGDEYGRKAIAALGHAYEGQTIAPTCTTEGCVRYTCTRCSHQYDSEIQYALGHLYQRNVQSYSTCTSSGVRTHYCERCGDYYTSVIPSLGHTYEIIDQSGRGDSTIRTYSCKTCGHSYTQRLGDQYEAVSSYVEYLFKQYSPYMIWVFLATAGVWSIAMGIAMIVARRNEEREKARKMVFNYCIGLIIIFAILVAAPYLVRGIAVLVTG